MQNSLIESCRFVGRKIPGFFLKRLKILFSDKDDWEESIRYGFRYTRHELIFDFFSSERVNCDIIVPLTIDDLKWLNVIRQFIIANPIPVPSLDSLCLCDDKERFNKALEENDFGNYIPQRVGESQYPYVLKKKTDQWGLHSHIILSREQELQFSDEISSPEYLKQQLVLGQKEYATHLLFSNR